MQSRAWVEVDAGALAHNAGVIRRAIPETARIGILVKADGYGHGMLVAARAALAGGADQLVVSSIEEGLALREAGVTAPILIVYPIDPRAIDEPARAGLEISVSGVDGTRHLLEGWASSAARTGGGVLRLQVEVDSGMGRGGVPPADLASVTTGIDATAGTEIVGIWSHLANGSDPVRSGEQQRTYEAALGAVAATGRDMPARHLVATEGLFCGTAPAYDMVRTGLGFYGELGVDVQAKPALASLAAELRPAMTVGGHPARLEWMPAGSTVGYGSEWTAERPSLVATLPIGYADGWTRGYWPGASALVRGRRFPLIGRVSMDSVCVDVTDVGDAGEVGYDEEFILLGGQGEERITPGELARLRGSITNEVFCDFGPRLERRVVGAESGPSA